MRDIPRSSNHGLMEERALTQRSIKPTDGFEALGRVVAAGPSAQRNQVARVDYTSTPLDAGQVGIDAPVHIASGIPWEPLDGDSTAAWHRMLALNVVVAANITKAAPPTLAARPVAGSSNSKPVPRSRQRRGCAYATFKAWVHRLTEHAR